MAFSTTNVKKTYFGNCSVTLGNWSGSVGDAPGSIGVQGGQVYLYKFLTNLSSGPQQVNAIPSSPSGTTGTVTLTVYNQNTVTNGTFLIIHA